MRLLVISDLHLEFGPFLFAKPMPEFDVAVFAGDVHKPINAALEWMVEQREAGPLRDREIVYVAGNHEFYKSEMKGSLTAGSELADKVGIHLLHRRPVPTDSAVLRDQLQRRPRRLAGSLIGAALLDGTDLQVSSEEQAADR